MTEARLPKPREAVTGAVYPDFALTDEQWNEIARLADIPSSAAGGKARLMVQAHIEVYRQNSRREMLFSDDVRKELAKIRGALCDSQAGFLRLAGLLPANLQISFSQELRILRLLEERYFVRGIGHEPRKTGPKTAAAYMLVGCLIAFVKHVCDKTIRRSNKRSDTSREYIRYVCKIADPSIGPGTIEKAMRYYSEHRGQTLEEATELALKHKAKRKAKKENTAKTRLG
jgi:hypothetical protein